MVDDSQSNQGQGAAAGLVTAGGTGVATSGVVVDKSKTAEQYMTEAESTYIVPQLVREKFPDLVKLIYETESMNQEEREYWLQIMPIMTEDQIVKFREILVNEKQQLEKLDQEYEQEVGSINQKHTAQIDEAQMKAKMDEIKAEESSAEVDEAAREQELLNQLDNMDN